ncbi:MFS transporter [Rouxiella badensis]|jgi:DHA1 family inner membrane transport protein|uniref:MFS transporter n=1 Tax=Rouxiella badensis TaxID=1646377 RepID=UPI0003680F7D|nr:MFS transporter [Rouxiella badensis]MCC3704468.1 hypothetical protein [Rouxiella badensis]MCC3731981.1 hypothetical protein [Rouxiella badensis]MCC3746515.1 hypothetical protein [Rouxiella badensis]MCC3757370.1 hypothetical protein [Rouxiella badensis]WAT09853.1 MFS transporter [Rouxiella badensis]
MNSLHVKEDSTVRLPVAIYALSFGIFAMVSSEFQGSAIINAIAMGLRVSVALVGYWVSWYACAMMLGGPNLPILPRSLAQYPVSQTA